MKVCLYKVPQGFQPDSQHDADLLASVRNGDVVYCDIKKRRNPAFHRKAFAMLHQIFDNQDRFDDFDQFYLWMKLAAGLVDHFEFDNGKTVTIPKSLSFGEMDDTEFSGVYEKFKTVAYEQLGLGWVLVAFG